MEKVDKKDQLILLLTAIGIMLICTKSSPFYPYNDWGDANIYFTMGKGILQGQIPYRDLYDHKGPLIYIAYSLAALISKKNFLGVWFLEIAAAYFFLLYSYKILRLFCDEKVIVMMPVYAAVVYAADHMRHGGSAEELCLPLLSYGLYILLEYLLNGKKFKSKKLLMLGITSGCVLWTKYTMLGFYVGWIVIPAIMMLTKKQYKEFAKTLGYIAAGVMIITFPIILYFGLQSALDDLFKVYFYNNIFLYTGEKVSFGRLLLRTFWNILYVVKNNFVTFGMIIIGNLYLLLTKKAEVYFSILLEFLGLVLLVLTAETLHGYYSMCFSVFCVFGFAFLWQILERIECKIAVSFAVMFLFAYFTGYNKESLFGRKELLPQYQFAEIMNMSDDPTLLNYGFLDGGFYTVAGIVPTNKYFFEANINLPEMKESQQEIIANGQVEYVVTFDEQYQWTNYEKIASADYQMEGNKITYYLYKLIN